MKLPLFSDPNRQAKYYDVLTDAANIVATRRRWYFCAECDVSLHGPEGIYVERHSEGKYAKHSACGNIVFIPEEGEQI